MTLQNSLKMKCNIKVDRGANCFFSNMRDLVNHILDLNLKEYSLFFVSESHKITYDGTNENPVKNFHIQSLHDSIFRICEYFHLDCSFYLKQRKNVIDFLESCIANSQPALLIANSQLFTYQKPPDYLKNAEAKHMVIVHGVDSKQKIFYAFDTYVYETTAIGDTYEVELPYDEVKRFSFAAYRVFLSKKLNVEDKIEINYRKILHDYLNVGCKNGVNVFTALGDDLKRLKILPKSLVRKYLEDIHYFLKIRYGFVNQYLGNMMDDILCFQEHKAFAWELYEKYLEAWSYLFARLILSNYMDSPKIIDRVISGLQQIEECQRSFFYYLCVHCKNK